MHKKEISNMKEKELCEKIRKNIYFVKQEWSGKEGYFGTIENNKFCIFYRERFTIQGWVFRTYQNPTLMKGEIEPEGNNLKILYRYRKSTLTNIICVFGLSLIGYCFFEMLIKEIDITLGNIIFFLVVLLALVIEWKVKKTEIERFEKFWENIYNG